MESNLLQLVLETTVQVLLPVLLGAAVVLVKEAVAKIRASIRKDQLETAEALIRRLVAAAEQNGLTGAIAKEGAAKKQWVLDQAEVYLAKQGIYLDLDAIDALIEGIVYDELGWDKKAAEILSGGEG